MHGNQTCEETITLNEEFAREVADGLSASPKHLSSKYFYDEAGDALFVKIMNMPEYYLTDCEFEILSEQSEDLIGSWGMGAQAFDLFELGAGDGSKTIELLKKLDPGRVTFCPVDISHNALTKLTSRLAAEVPDLPVRGLQGEYFEVLHTLHGTRPKVILFLGSNLGNLSDEQAHLFMEKLSEVMNPGDKLLLGVDLKKSPEIILPAYNDAAGYTREFNLNLLRRINRELGGNFDLKNFRHYPQYDNSKGVASSYLVSNRKQEVCVEAIGQQFSFEEGEAIHTEISRKYDMDIIGKISLGTGLAIRAEFYDSRRYFCDILLEKSEV